MEKLQDTLLIFNKISLEMGYRTIAILKAISFDSKKIIKLGPNQSVLNSLINMNIIDSCSYIDEYEKYFGNHTEEIYLTKILEIKRICKPLISQIKKWKDLKSFRSSFIVHNLRTKDNEMVFRKEVNYNVPRGIYEIELLNHCIQLMSYIIEKEFKSEIENAKANFKLRISPPKGFKKSDCWRIIDELILITNQNLKKENKDYLIKVSSRKSPGELKPP
jgi:hypothetical protein